MDKSQFLTIAHSVRKERVPQSTHSTTGRNFETECSLSLRFGKLAEDLTKTEQLVLVASLKASLEKERRRCKGRKLNYDPGRHISLYIAIKTLSSYNKKPPE